MVIRKQIRLNLFYLEKNITIEKKNREESILAHSGIKEKRSRENVAAVKCSFQINSSRNSMLC